MKKWLLLLFSLLLLIPIPISAQKTKTQKSLFYTVRMMIKLQMIPKYLIHK